MGEDDEEENDKIDELLSLAEDYKEQQQHNGAGHETGRASVSPSKELLPITIHPSIDNLFLPTQNLQSQYLQQFERLLPHIANTTRIKCPPDQRMNDDLGRNYIMRGRHVIQFITYWNKAQRYFVRIRWRRIISVSKNHVQHVV